MPEKDRCAGCGGKGLKETNRNLKVSIPKGVTTGTKIRLSNQGLLKQYGGQRGHLYLFVTLKPHPIFETEGYDVVLKYPLKLTQAIFGGKIVLPTLYGPKEYEVRPGTQDGHTGVLYGCGLTNPHTRRKADMYVKFSVEIPSISNLGESLRVPLTAAEDASSLPLTYSELRKIEEYLSKGA